jgi:hypothetical protein
VAEQCGLNRFVYCWKLIFVSEYRRCCSTSNTVQLVTVKNVTLIIMLPSFYAFVVGLRSERQM